MNLQNCYQRNFAIAESKGLHFVYSHVSGDPKDGERASSSVEPIWGQYCRDGGKNRTWRRRNREW